jgi:beta-N-acetylhexosaminidase
MVEIRRVSLDPPQTAIDEEGGAVHRLPPDLPTFPSPESWGDKDPRELERVARRFASLLRGLGFSVNLAPVVDSCKGEPSDLLKSRLFSPDPVMALPYIRAFIRGMRWGGMATCLKHFPNHGLVIEDSHKTLPQLDLDVEEVRQTSFLPFLEGVKERAEFLMLAHILWTPIDPRFPVSASRRAVEIVRKELEFSGIILTDDMEMGALKRYEREELLIRALVSGVNGVLYCGKLEGVLPLAEILIHEAERSSSLREYLKENTERWKRLKPPDLPNPEKIQAFVDEGMKDPLQ